MPEQNKPSADQQPSKGYVFAPQSAKIQNPEPAGAESSPLPTKQGIKRQPDDEETRPPKTRLASPVPAASVTSAPTTGHHVREDRLACSFPGILKILIPEKTFTPVSVPVRVANLSASGAMVEVHDRAQIDKHIALPNRFFELKIAHPELPILRGTIAWSDVSKPSPVLGLMCFERHPKLAEIVGAADSNVKVTGPPPLPMPTLESLPTVVRDKIVVLRGSAPEAMEIVIKGEKGKKSAKVVDGRFEFPIELEPDSENQFSLRSVAGQRRSRSYPIQINCEITTKKGRFHFDAKMQKASAGENVVTLEFAGSVRQAERVLFRLSQLLATSDRVEIDTKLQSLAGFDKRLFDSLMAEGAVLAADTSKNEAASKLLDELL